MKKNILLTAAALLTTLAGAAQWQPAGDRIGTEWGENLDPQNVLPEYPRPQMTRTQVQDGWQNLNGLWNYAILPMGETPEKYDGQILVPFAVESSLPYSVRTKALKLIAPVEERMRRAAMITAEHSVTEDGCTVHLAMADGKGKIIDLSFLCAGEEQAAEIEKRFRRSAEEYYQRIAQMFTE